MSQLRNIHFPVFSDNFFMPVERLFANGANAAAGGFAADVEEGDKAYTIYAELPGITKEQVSINVENNTLTVAADFSRPPVGEGKGEARALLRERFAGKVERKFRLPRNIQSGKISAQMENGVLRLTLPKASDAQARNIVIQ